MKVAIMQPYFFPYIGYFQLIKAADTFVVYDNIEYTKKGWINRNRILVNGKDDFITLPLRKDSDYLNINQRYLALSFENEKAKMLRKISAAYQKAPFFSENFTIVEEILNYQDDNLFNYVLNSIKILCERLEITTKIVISSSLQIDHQLKSENKVIELCKVLNGSIYTNPIGGLNLYNPDNFKKNGIDLEFQKSNTINYNQFNNVFIPWLSILDVLMFNSDDELKRLLLEFSVERRNN